MNVDELIEALKTVKKANKKVKKFGELPVCACVAGPNGFTSRLVSLSVNLAIPTVCWKKKPHLAIVVHDEQYFNSNWTMGGKLTGVDTPK